MNKIIGPGESAPQTSPEKIIEEIRAGNALCVVLDLKNGVSFHTADNLTPQGTRVLIEVLESGLEQLRATLRPTGKTQ